MTRLFVNYYNDSNPLRQAEINECISRNISNQLIDQICIVVDNAATNFHDFDNNAKVEIINSSGRPTYSSLFALANSKISGNDLTILANADIYFREYDVLLSRNYLSRCSCFALSRWDEAPDGSIQLFDRADSQDSWIFKGPIKTIENCAFTMGRPGCDNAIAQRIAAAGYAVYNPAPDIKSQHLHNTSIRNYDATDPAQTVERPYKLIPPERLENIPGINWVKGIAQITAGSQYSQYGEDAIIDYIFDNIGVTNSYFVDLGAGAYGESTMSNTRKLKQAGWNGYGVDATNKGESWIIEQFIRPDNILDILGEQHTPTEFDFLNLDIDSSDFWVLKKVLEKYAPRCICTEYNGTLNPDIPVVLKYEEGYTWDETNKYGYSFAAGEKLLQAYGYRIIFNMLNQNIFALKKELVEGLSFDVYATQVGYHPHNHYAVWETY